MSVEKEVKLFKKVNVFDENDKVISVVNVPDMETILEIDQSFKITVDVPVMEDYEVEEF